MKAIFMDAYRAKDKIIVWLKNPEKEIRIEFDFSVKFYLDYCELAKSVINRFKFKNQIVYKYDYQNEKRKVFEIKIKNIGSFERIISGIEKFARHKLIMYNADISPEQLFIYKNNLRPFSFVEVLDGKIFSSDLEVSVPLKKLEIFLDINSTSKIKSIKLNNEHLVGDEHEILNKFQERFYSINPDIIYAQDAFVLLPLLVNRLNIHGLNCPFHRWDEKPIKSKGGKSFMSYGRVIYRNYAIRLNGRFLIDGVSTVGSECNIDSIVELSNLTGTRFQHVGSRSFGAAFQHSLIRELVNRDYLVPFKEKPVDPPMTLHHMLKFDRVGHTFDPKVGLHHDVAEIDFSSLFPWIIYNYNISTETILGGEGPYQEVPGLPLKISLNKKGIVPLAIKPLIDRRMHYKKNPSSINKVKTLGLKWVLVTSYGYLRFREFKLGIASSHMAIGAFARDIMIKTKELCEDHGFEIVHGIIDSLYIKKKGITKKEVLDLCREIELEMGIPISFEGIFKWIVFLPSVNDIDRPVPTRYYGVFDNNDIKARGLEVRQQGSPKVVKDFQARVLSMMSKCNDVNEIVAIFPEICKLLRYTINTISDLPSEELSLMVRVSKVEYEKNIPQKAAVNLIKDKGINVVAGQKINYIFSANCKNGVVLPEDYESRPDIERYKRLLVRSLFVLLQPFGFTKYDISEFTEKTRQSKIIEYFNNLEVICLPKIL